MFLVVGMAGGILRVAGMSVLEQRVEAGVARKGKSHLRDHRIHYGGVEMVEVGNDSTKDESR